MIRTWSIDSLRIRIPLAQCKIIDSELNSIQHTISSNTGEIIESKLNTVAHRSETGITTKISISKEPIDKLRFELHAVILVNSKSLQKDYFTGITKSTLNQVYKYIMSLNVISFSFDSFRQAQCTDIDIKTDISCTDTDMKAAFDILNSGCKEHKQIDRGIRSSWTKDNKMIQFNRRQNTDVIRSPFLKIYAKSIQLMTDSKEFAVNYLSSFPSDLWRIEYTIKNKKHLNALSLPNTLEALASCSQTQYELAYQTSLRAVMNARLKKDKVLSDNISPKDIPMINAIIICLDTGCTWSMLKSNLLGSLEGSNRTKRATHLQDLFDSYIKPIEAYSNFERIDSVLEQIGYVF
jgi:hypothetical protein